MSLATGSLSSSIHEIPTEAKLNKLLEEEEGDLIVMEIYDDLLRNVMETVEEIFFEKQAKQFVVKCALQAIEKTMEMNFYFHNLSYCDMEKGSWEPDTPIEPSIADNWASYRLQLTNEEIAKEIATEDVVVEIETDNTKDEIELTPSNSTESDICSLTQNTEEMISTSSNDDESENTDLTDGDNDGSITMNTKVCEKFSNISAKSVTSAEKTLPIDRMSSSIFARTVIGETDKGLCVPNVTIVPASTVVKEVPEIETFEIIKVDEKKIRVSKKYKIPKRRSDIKMKIAKTEEVKTGKKKDRYQ